MRVLIVEDDPELGAVLTDGLREQAIDACAAHGYWFIKGRLMRLLAAG